MCGVMLGSLSGGGGELSFLALTHYYGHIALAGWGFGTGAAGLVAAGIYALATSTLQISPRMTLLWCSFLPLILLASFFCILPMGPLHAASGTRSGYEAIETEEPDESELLHSSVLSADERGGSVYPKGDSRAASGFKANLYRAKGLFFP